MCYKTYRCSQKVLEHPPYEDIEVLKKSHCCSIYIYNITFLFTLSKLSIYHLSQMSIQQVLSTPHVWHSRKTEKICFWRYQTLLSPLSGTKQSFEYEPNWLSRFIYYSVCLSGHSIKARCGLLLDHYNLPNLTHSIEKFYVFIFYSWSLHQHFAPLVLGCCKMVGQNHCLLRY